MANKKTVNRASTSRERKLALALRAVLDAWDDNAADATNEEDMDAASTHALAVLKEFGYSTLEGIPKRLARLNEQLATALTAGDGKEIARLGLELERAKTGKPSVTPVAVVVKVRKPRAAKVAVVDTSLTQSSDEPLPS